MARALLLPLPMVVGRWIGAAALLVVLGCGDAAVVDADGSSESSGDPTVATVGEGQTTVPVPEGCEVVVVPDPALASALRGELGLPEGAEISGERLASKDILFLVGAGITDLSGLECAVGVEQFFASDNQIVDTTVLASLPRLSNVSLDGNAIADLSPWTGHPLLFTLGVSNNQITSTAPLHDLPVLANLDVSGNPITAMEGLDAVVGSSRVDLQACKLEYSIVSPK